MLLSELQTSSAYGGSFFCEEAEDQKFPRLEPACVTEEFIPALDFRQQIYNCLLSVFSM